MRMKYGASGMLYDGPSPCPTPTYICKDTTFKNVSIDFLLLYKSKFTDLNIPKYRFDEKYASWNKTFL